MKFPCAIYYIFFLICTCKSLVIHRLTLGDWRFLMMLFCPIFFVLFLSKATKLNLLVLLHEEVCIDLFILYYLLLSFSLSFSFSLSLSLLRSYPLIALNTNLWMFSSLKCLRKSWTISLFTQKIEFLYIYNIKQLNQINVVCFFYNMFFLYKYMFSMMTKTGVYIHLMVHQTSYENHLFSK